VHDEKPIHPSIFVASDYAAGWLATCGILSALLRRAKEGRSYRVRVSLVRTALWLPELGIFDRDYATKTAGSNDEHHYPFGLSSIGGMRSSGGAPARYCGQ
jgi:crotonobetainyl-CoA:carnitine CoA-transferase CaiB-like acyl-CoA transferase